MVVWTGLLPSEPTPTPFPAPWMVTLVAIASGTPEIALYVPAGTTMVSLLPLPAGQPSKAFF